MDGGRVIRRLQSESECALWLVGHGESPSVSSPIPRGDVARPALSRLNALRRTSTGQPNCSARLAAIAASEAMMPAALPARWLVMKISAGSPLGYLDAETVNRSP